LADSAWGTDPGDEAIIEEVSFHTALLLEHLANPEWGNWADKVAEATFLLTNLRKVISIQAWKAASTIKAKTDVSKAAEELVTVLIGHNPK